MRVIGIDLGSTSIKAIELDTAFGRYEIHDYHDVKIIPGTDPSVAIRALFKVLPKSPDRIAITLPTAKTTFRNLQIPTKDKKTIQATIGFELDDDLPFPLDQSVYDYSVLSQSGQTTHLHVTTTLTKNVEEEVAKWNNAAVDPDVITSEAWAYRILLNRVLSPADQEQPVLLLKIGHERTIFYVHWRGFPVLAREIRWGGYQITLALCKKYGITLEEAENTKTDNGFVIPRSQSANATPEQIEFSNTLLEPIRDLIKDLRQIVLTCKSITHTSPGTIYIAGGTSLLPGLNRLIEEEISVPIRHLRVLTSINPSGVTYSEHSDAVFVTAAATALCLVKSPDKSTTINLRKGNQAKVGRAKELTIASLKAPLAAVATILLTFIVSMVVQGSSYRGRLADVDSQLERSIKGFFGSISSSAVRTYMSSTSTLRTSIGKELNKQRELAKLLSPNPKSPLSFLNEISSSVPEDVVVDMTQLQVGASPTSSYSPVDGQTVSLTFLVSNPQMAERLASLMNSKISGLQRSKIDEVQAPDGSGQRWKITLSGKPVEDAYGH